MTGAGLGVRHGLIIFVTLLAVNVHVAAHELFPADKLKTGQFDIEYVEPKNPAHRPLYDELKKIKLLEKL